jgi:hypothetical protein
MAEECRSLLKVLCGGFFAMLLDFSNIVLILSEIAINYTSKNNSISKV